MRDVVTSTVKLWKDEPGYGFIYHPQAGERDVMVHHSNILGIGRKTLLNGQRVEFEIVETPKGLEAINVRTP